jgi:hypothetical protein
VLPFCGMIWQILFTEPGAFGSRRLSQFVWAPR